MNTNLKEVLETISTNNLTPIVAETPKPKKVLEGYDWAALRYFALQMEQYGEKLLNDDENYIMDSELYLAGGEGIELDENFNLRTLYLNEYGIVVGDVYDKENDKFIQVIIG